MTEAEKERARCARAIRAEAADYRARADLADEDGYDEQANAHRFAARVLVQMAETIEDLEPVSGD